MYYFINQNVENLKEKSNERSHTQNGFCTLFIIHRILISFLVIIDSQHSFLSFAIQSGNQVKQLRKLLMMMFTLVIDSWIEESVLHWKDLGIEKDHYYNIIVS